VHLSQADQHILATAASTVRSTAEELKAVLDRVWTTIEEQQEEEAQQQKQEAAQQQQQQAWVREAGCVLLGVAWPLLLQVGSVQMLRVWCLAMQAAQGVIT